MVIDLTLKIQIILVYFKPQVNLNFAHHSASVTVVTCLEMRGGHDRDAFKFRVYSRGQSRGSSCCGCVLRGSCGAVTGLSEGTVTDPAAGRVNTKYVHDLEHLGMQEAAWLLKMRHF